MPAAKPITKDGLEYIQWDDHDFGLGLVVPKNRFTTIPALSVLAPSMDMGDIKQIVQSDDFSFGRKWFDSSWITDQNGYGSCAAYGGSSALAKARVLMGQPRVDLSGDYLYSLVNHGRDRGSMLDDNMRMLLRKGVAKRETVPRGKIYRNQYQTGPADEEALRYRAHEAFALPDEAAMATALCMRMPVVIAIHVNRNWRKFDAEDVLAPAHGPGNHCEHLDDIKWSDRRGCFLYRKATSHGRSYSGDGYCWTTWKDHYASTIKYHQFYAVPSAIEDTSAPSPPIDGAEPEPEPVNDTVLSVVSSSSCGACVQWERNERPKLKIKVEKGAFPGNLVPRFALWVNGKKHNQVGYWKAADIEAKVREMGG